MRIRGLGRLRRLRRRATIPFQSRVVILMYHRIIDPTSDPWELCVSPAHFAEQLAYLREHFHVLKLRDLTRLLQEDRLPKRAVVITFDDGYADNLWYAKPLLEQFRLPATIFIASGHIDYPHEFWWDGLERVLLHPTELLSSFQLSVQDRIYKWPVKTPQERERAYFATHQLLQPLSDTQRNQALQQIFTCTDKACTCRPNNRTLTTPELRDLSQSDFVDIGAHTITHPYLSSLSYDDQLSEISNSRRQLEDILKQSVKMFSYPYGNLNSDSVQAVEVAGFEAAVTVAPTAVERGVNQYQLGRFDVDDWNGEVFGRYLNQYFNTV